MNDKRRLLPLKALIMDRFTNEQWLEVGVITGCSDIVTSGRLLRSLHFNDEDYGGNVLDVLSRIDDRDPKLIDEIDKYIESLDGGAPSDFISDKRRPRVVTFAPSVFDVPDGLPDPDLVAVMMPFGGAFQPVYDAIKAASATAGFKSERVDNIWEHSTIIQDIFTLIFRSRVVIVDFSQRNPNVFYEAGIAHTLGKIVVPIAQSMDDVPFDLKHHRIAIYLNNGEGRKALQQKLADKLASVKAAR